VNCEHRNPADTPIDNAIGRVISRPVRVAGTGGDPLLSTVSRGQSLVQLLFVFGVWLLPAAIRMVLIPLGNDLAIRDFGPWFYLHVFVHGMLAVALITLALLATKQSWRTVGCICRSFGMDVLAAGIALAAIYMVQMAIIAVLRVFWEDSLAQMVKDHVALLDQFPRVHPAVILLFCMFVGFYEELLFRGFMLTRVKTLVGNWPAAILLSSAVFGVAHMYQGPFSAFRIFIVSVILSVVFVSRRSIIAPALAHVAIDVFAFSLAYSSEVRQILERYLPAGPAVFGG